MNKNQIKVGQRYKNKSPEVKGIVFLGVGEKTGRRVKNPQMIVLATGKIVAGPKSHKIKDFWKNFQEI